MVYYFQTILENPSPGHFRWKRGVTYLAGLGAFPDNSTTSAGCFQTWVSHSLLVSPAVCCPQRTPHGLPVPASPGCADSTPESGRLSLPPPLVGTACCRLPCNPLCMPFGEGSALSLPVTALGQILGLCSLVRSPWWVTFPPLHPQGIQNTSPVSSLVGFKPCCALPSGLRG